VAITRAEGPPGEEQTRFLLRGLRRQTDAGGHQHISSWEASRSWAEFAELQRGLALRLRGLPPLPAGGGGAANALLGLLDRARVQEEPYRGDYRRWLSPLTRCTTAQPLHTLSVIAF
jgi:hypothetical protein